MYGTLATMKTNEKYKSVEDRRVVYIPQDLYERAMSQVKTDGTNLSLVIRQFLTMWLNKTIKPDFTETLK